MAHLDLDDLINSARDVDQPSPAHADQLFNKVIQGAAGGGGIDSVVETSAQSATASVVPQAVLALGALIGLGTAGAIAVSSWNEAPKPALPVAVQAPIAPTPAPQEVAPAPSEESGEGSLKEEQPEATGKPAQKVAASRTKTNPTDRLAEEVALVRRAKLAFNGKKHQEALRLLDSYAAKFPQGTLKGEAQATRVLVLCALKQTDEAKRQAGTLDANSPLGAKMKDGCKVR